MRARFDENTGVYSIHFPYASWGSEKSFTYHFSGSGGYTPPPLIGSITKKPFLRVCHPTPVKEKKNKQIKRFWIVNLSKEVYKLKK